MDSEFLMQNNVWLERERDSGEGLTHVSEGLRKRLLGAALERAWTFYAGFLGRDTDARRFDSLLHEYIAHEKEARAMGLFRPGGIREKEHLNLWCLCKVVSPDFYLESGVFMGSSLHAFMGASSIRHAMAIDPDLSRVNSSPAYGDRVIFIGDMDFSELQLDLGDDEVSLAYFDDHVDSAARVLQASEKGLKYLVFDDSTGLEGVCQRAYPAVPTIPMILDIECFRPGDRLAWTVRQSWRLRLRETLKGLRGGGFSGAGGRVSLDVTEEFVNRCRRARDRIGRCVKLPDLGELLPPSRPAPVVDSSKYLIELV